jgi:NADP-dependent 3-hydroxy acid dehydrogenase YdfG
MLMKNLREEEWAHTVEINCKGALNCVGAVLPGMLGRDAGP